MYGCESWTIKKAEHWRIDAFELWCWRRLLRVPWTARRSNQFILEETSPECSLERLMWKLKLQNLGHLMRRADSLAKTLMLERLKAVGEGTDRGWEGWMASPTQWTWVWVNSGSWWWTEWPGVLWSMGSQRVWHNWETKMNWTELMGLDAMISVFWVLSFKSAFSFSSSFFFFFSFIFISWRLLYNIVVGFVIHWHESAMELHVFPILIPPSHLPLYPILLGLPSAPGPSTLLMHPTWAGDLFHPW